MSTRDKIVTVVVIVIVINVIAYYMATRAMADAPSDDGGPTGTRR